jgi:diaminopimelate epimerase
MQSTPEALNDNNIAAVARKLSRRNFSIGGDGVVLIVKSDVADAKMRMFNADGSEGRMCGNAIRCVGKFLYDFGYVNVPNVTVDTLSGLKKLTLSVKDGKAEGATVNMGLPVLNPADVPLNAALLPNGYKTADKIIDMPYSVAGVGYRINAVSMGNPHCVVFCQSPVEKLCLEKIGPLFECDPLFPERVNTEFVNVLERNRLRMRVWERGSGETLACGTGACAVAVAAVLNGICDADSKIAIELTGGILEIQVGQDGVLMSGPAELAFKGDVEL